MKYNLILMFGQIVDHYRSLAERYNINDENEIHHIIEEALKNPEQLLDVQAMSSLISDQNKKDEFMNMVETHGGKVSIQDLLSQQADMRIKTSEGYMNDVAPADIKARADGIKQKTETLEHFRENSIVQENYYEQEIDRLRARKSEITQYDIERSTKNETLTDIEQETRYIKDKVHGKDEKEESQEKE